MPPTVYRRWQDELEEEFANENERCHACGQLLPEHAKRWAVVVSRVRLRSGRYGKLTILVTTNADEARAVMHQYRATGHSADVVEAGDAP
jgi:ribosomal protein S27AE